MSRLALYCARYDFEPFGKEPLGLGYIASYLLQKGYNVKIVHSIGEALLYEPDIIGISAVSQVIPDACNFAQAMKQTGCKTILGGYHITCSPKRLPLEFDIGVMFEGELTMEEILQGKSLGDIKGICYREGNEIIINAPRPYIEDIDALPMPQRTIMTGGELDVLTSRGCPYSCIFCANHTFWGDRYKLRNPKSVVDEIEYLVNMHNPDGIFIMDDLWMANKERFHKITDDIVARGLPERVYFYGLCRSNLVDEEVVKKLKSINYSLMRFGAETGSETLLRKLKGNNITIADHQRTIDLCDKYEIPCGASFMFGVPGETTNDLDKTIDFLKQNKGKFMMKGFYLFCPLPGTKVWETLEQQGLVDDETPVENFQADFCKSNFSWDRVLYFNESNIPINVFRDYIDRVFDIVLSY